MFSIAFHSLDATAVVRLPKGVQVLFRGGKSWPSSLKRPVHFFCCWKGNRGQIQRPLMSNQDGKGIALHHKRSLSDGVVYNFSAIVGIQNALEAVHSFTCLPWWFVIFASTAVLRTLITLPLARKQAHLLAQLELLKPIIDELSEALKHNLAAKGKQEKKTSEEVNRVFKKEFRKYAYDLYQQNGCNPVKLFILPWVQIPIWITISLALRNLTGFAPGNASVEGYFPVADGMVSEGLLWITDLTTPDPLWTLPVLLGLTNLANIELNALRKGQPATRDRILTGIFRMLSIGMVGVASQVPAAMTLYWATSSTYGLLQNTLIRSPAVRRRLNIPRTPSESQTPYRDMWKVLQQRFEHFIKIQRTR